MGACAFKNQGLEKLEAMRREGGKEGKKKRREGGREGGRAYLGVRQSPVFLGCEGVGEIGRL